jgi:transketolase
MNHREIELLCRDIRREILTLCERTGTGHVGSAFSVVETLAILYMNIMRGNVQDPDRDRLILSKGHACAALCAVLHKKGWLPSESYACFAKNGSTIGHHPHHEPRIGFDANTGSLGHGLSIGAGIAFAVRKDSKKTRTFVVMSDGETNEGSVWEAAAFAGHHALCNLCAVVDNNKIQALGDTENILNQRCIADKWRSFGWHAVEVDGHSPADLESAFTQIETVKRPLAVIAHTVKGKGVRFMEGNLLWHYRVPKGDEYKAAMKELDL